MYKRDNTGRFWNVVLPKSRVLAGSVSDVNAGHPLNVQLKELGPLPIIKDVKRVICENVLVFDNIHPEGVVIDVQPE